MVIVLYYNTQNTTSIATVITTTTKVNINKVNKVIQNTCPIHYKTTDMSLLYIQLG